MFEYLNVNYILLGIPFSFMSYIGISMFKEYYLQIKKNLKKSKKI